MNGEKKPETMLTQEQFNELKNIFINIASETSLSGVPSDGLVDTTDFMRLAECKKDFANQMFKNKELVRLGILFKITPLNKQGGWRIHWQKYLKWSKKNAEMALDA